MSNLVEDIKALGGRIKDELGIDVDIRILAFNAHGEVSEATAKRAGEILGASFGTEVEESTCDDGDGQLTIKTNESVRVDIWFNPEAIVENRDRIA